MPATSIVRSIPPQPHLHYAISLAATNVRITVFGIWMSDGNQLPPAGRNRLPHLVRQTIDPARWGRRFRLPFQWPQSMVGPKTVKHPPVAARNEDKAACGTIDGMLKLLWPFLCLLCLGADTAPRETAADGWTR